MSFSGGYLIHFCLLQKINKNSLFCLLCSDSFVHKDEFKFIEAKNSLHYVMTCFNFFLHIKPSQKKNRQLLEVLFLPPRVENHDLCDFIICSM